MSETRTLKNLHEAKAYMYINDYDFDKTKTEISAGRYLTYFVKKHDKRVAVYDEIYKKLFIY